MTQLEQLRTAAGRDVSRETYERVEHYVAALIDENQRQNLVSPATIPNLFHRHIVDSAQLLALSPRPSEPWVDIGTGPGLPGLVIALVTDAPVTLVEPRALRVQFLERMAAQLDLRDRVTIVHGKAHLATGRFANITARAVAALPKFFELAGHLADAETIWVLPKGKSAKSELEETKKLWQGSFRLVPSQTDPDAAILVATGVQRKGKR
ncbi:16S rRNA (guanine(527)-N(7))-methyltransferase RsmG [Sphingomicrobium flavum]|uniref:16S rRNA (guanine(527)-N(7))-methyltransferase RsmG n=1 Tax=Sphingomicrobium flavum TaxID=1229164 RepID=UPI0021AD6DA4|nr:16S rRNA (guanine(527)-N(7))-methyltransferase RsmG [Sphingomicrobium flavum]